MNISPKVADRALLVGMTGSGKTTLAQVLLASRPFVAAYDAKGLLRWPGYHRVTTLAELFSTPHPRVIYAPNHEELVDRNRWNAFFQWIYERRNTTVYVDEVYAVTDKSFIPHYYHACLTRGREMGVSVISSTQRPMQVPQAIMSESEHYYVFRLQLPQDKKRIREIVALDELKINAIKKHSFFYANADGEILGPLKLNLA